MAADSVTTAATALLSPENEGTAPARLELQEKSLAWPVSKRSVSGRLTQTVNASGAELSDAATQIEDSMGRAAGALRIRLSDPAMKKIMAARMQRVSTNREFALRFLQEIGIATPTGRLSKRYGG
jgi:hypothetical protein